MVVVVVTMRVAVIVVVVVVMIVVVSVVMVPVRVARHAIVLSVGAAFRIEGRFYVPQGRPEAL